MADVDAHPSRPRVHYVEEALPSSESVKTESSLRMDESASSPWGVIASQRATSAGGEAEVEGPRGP